MTELAQSRSLLEIQYENEVGTGLGPTMEFYTLVSKELQRADLSLWKGETVKITSEDVMEADETDPLCIDYVFTPAGLYPLPMARNAKSSHKNKIKTKYNFVGKFIAKAVLDNRMVDLPFSLPFFQWLLKEESMLTSQDLRNIDLTIASTVSQLEGKT
jgi:E3 ubiquitin-protein ligase TRIP12